MRRRFEDRQHEHEDHHDHDHDPRTRLGPRPTAIAPGPPGGRFDWPAAVGDPTRMKRGDIRTILLIALQDGPAHG